MDCERYLIGNSGVQQSEEPALDWAVGHTTRMSVDTTALKRYRLRQTGRRAASSRVLQSRLSGDTPQRLPRLPHLLSRISQVNFGVGSFER